MQVFGKHLLVQVDRQEYGKVKRPDNSCILEYAFNQVGLVLFNKLLLVLRNVSFKFSFDLEERKCMRNLQYRIQS